MFKVWDKGLKERENWDGSVRLSKTIHGIPAAGCPVGIGPGNLLSTLTTTFVGGGPRAKEAGGKFNEITGGDALSPG
jgi:hypothetical protein